VHRPQRRLGTDRYDRFRSLADNLRRDLRQSLGMAFGAAEDDREVAPIGIAEFAHPSVKSVVLRRGTFPPGRHHADSVRWSVGAGGAGPSKRGRAGPDDHVAPPHHALSVNNSRPISMRRISLVPAPIS